MRYETALAYFKTNRAIAQAFTPHLSDAAITPWKKVGIIPSKRAIQLEKITGGALKIDPKCYEDPTDSSPNQDPV